MQSTKVTKRPLSAIQIDDDTTRIVITATPSELSSDSEKENVCCICLQAWKTSGEHRIVSLKCGHVFGEDCIVKWISTSRKCPVCQKRASRKDVRPIFLSSTPASELKLLREEKEREINGIKKRLKAEQRKRRKLEKTIESIQNKVTNFLHTNSGDYKTFLKDLFNEQFNNPTLQNKIQPKLQFQISREMLCKVPSELFAFRGDPMNIIFTHVGNGLLLTMNMMLDEPDSIRLEPRTENSNPFSITDLQYDQKSDEVICTTSLRKAKIVDLKNKYVTTTFNLNADPLCCSINHENNNMFACGLSNGTILIFDKRKTEKECGIINLPNNSSITSICFVSQQTENGILASQGIFGAFYCKNDNGVYNSPKQPLNINTNKDLDQCIGVLFDTHSKTCAASYGRIKSETRNITHYTFHPSSEKCNILTTINEPSLNLTYNEQPSILQNLLGDVIQSPTLLFSTNSASLIDVEDDDVVCVDTTVVPIFNLLAYTKKRKVTLVDANTGIIFQQLKSHHLQPITDIEFLNHSCGHFFGQISNDRFTLYTLK